MCEHIHVPIFRLMGPEVLQVMFFKIKVFFNVKIVNFSPTPLLPRDSISKRK